MSRTPDGHGPVPVPHPAPDAARVTRLDRWAWLAPPAVGIAVFLLGKLLFGKFARLCGGFVLDHDCPPVPLGLKYPPAGPSPAAGFAARVPVVPPAMLLIALSVAVLALGSVRMWRLGTAGWPARTRAAALGATLAAALAAGTFAAWRASTFFLAAEIFSAPHLPAGLGTRFLATLDFLTFAATVMLLAAFSRSVAVEPARTEWDADGVAERVGSLQVLLFLAATLLVLSLAARAALFRWGLSLAVKDDPATKVADEIVAAVTTAGGAAYTLVLAGIYGSSLLILRGRALRLAAARSGETTPAGRRKWMEERDLSVPVAKQAANLVATLAPLLAAGPLSAFTKLLGG